MSEIYGTVETGGTKILARVVDGTGRTLREGRWATGRPEAASDDLIGFFAPDATDLRAIGMAAFGPLVVDPLALDYGAVLPTTKPHWTGYNLRQRLEEVLRLPVGVDTDVNAAALAEQARGAGQGCRTMAYVTVGTGIGGGLAVDGRSLRGALHPEIGHLPLYRAPHDPAPSACRFHPACAEGLAAGPAVRARLEAGQDLVDRPELVALVAGYLGQLFAQLVLSWSPERIVVGGGVMATPGLLAAARQPLLDALNGFGVAATTRAPDFLVPAMLEHAGLDGALLLARAAAAGAS